MGQSMGQKMETLLGAEDIEKLESFDDGVSGYFYQMFSYLMEFMENGINEGKFTEEQAREDREIALWYAFACLNIDEYEYYWRAAQWMPASEKYAAGCGDWYYRYSVALLYCGRIRESWEYAEKGVKEEPSYPWTWLQAAKLRSFFGDTDGALEAVERGLALEPGDHEFLTLGQEIRLGATLEEMEYHWIDPESDRMLQDGLSEGADDKQRAISCIRINEEGLRRFRELFSPQDWEADDPYCRFHYMIQWHEVELVFCMNEAGLSKLNTDWLRKIKRQLDEGSLLVQEAEAGKSGLLQAIFFGLDYQVSLIYQLMNEEQYFQVWLAKEE